MIFRRIGKTALLAVAAILAFEGQLEAQKAVLTGQVRDAESGEALPFANVALTRVSDTLFMRGATTDFEGRFSIGDADTGSYLLMVSSVGYVTATQPLRLQADRHGLEVGLQRGMVLEEVKVVSERPLYAMDGEKNMYNTADDPSVQTGTASDALQNAPGVEVDAEGNITLRGVSSVEVWINDRPSHMNGEALKQYIKTLPAGAIERIEVITNPSARYSTSGGVINLVLNQKVKRNELFCFGANVSTQPNLSPWLSYVYSNEKVDINFYVNAHGEHVGYSREEGNTMFTAGGDTLLTRANLAEGKSRGLGGYAGGSLTWHIDSTTSLTGWLGGYPGWNWGRYDATSKYIEYPHSSMPGDFSFGSRTRDTNAYAGGYFGAWFEHRFDTTGRKLTVSLNGNMWGSRAANLYSRSYTVHTERDLLRKEHNRFISPSVSAEVGYLWPMGKGYELEIGATGSVDHTHETNQHDTAVAPSLFVRDDVRSYHENFNDYGLGGYATLTKRIGNFTAKVGLRASETLLRGDVNDNPAYHVNKNYLELTPSLHLSYRTKNFHNFSFSYTRRTSSPETDQLTRFKEYADENFETGNPALQQSHAHNLEAGWSKYFMTFGSVGLKGYFRANTDQISQLTDVIYEDFFGRVVNYSTYANVGSSHTEGIEANITYRPTAFFNLRMDASVFNNSFTYLGVEDHKVAYSVRLNAWTKLWGWLQVFANVHYASPSLSLYSLSNTRKGVDVGLSTDLLDNRLSIYVNANDIFRWQNWGSTGTNPLYQSTSTTQWTSSYVSLGVTWRIGKMELSGRAREGGDTGGMPQER